MRAALIKQASMPVTRRQQTRPHTLTKLDWMIFGIAHRGHRQRRKFALVSHRCSMAKRDRPSPAVDSVISVG
jgi:hypothetical protein